MRLDITQLRKKLASQIFRFYVPFLDQLNANARLGKWIRDNESIAIVKDRFDVYEFLESNVVRSEPIDYLEFGVFKGDTLRYWTSLNRHPESRFYGFDSFRGLPEGWGGSNAGYFNVDGHLPDIQDPRVRFVEGWFQDTLPLFLKAFSPRSRLVIHHDSDLYSSVLYCLTMTDSILAPGTIVMFDEFSSPLHEFRAYLDYVQSYRRELLPVVRTADYADKVAFIVENP